MTDPRRTEVIYGVQLLDDLHNYFPDILYNNSRFNNVRDVLDYITINTRRRFDLYSLGRSRYHPELSAPLPRQSTAGAGARGSSPVRTVAATATLEPLIFDIPIVNEVSDINPNLNLMNILNSMLSGNPSTLYSTNFMNPIEVRPTSQQIERATRTFNLLSRDSDEICPICQEEMNIGDRIREITTCEHSFHTGCIDTWFRRNVHCPVCRHDIRDVEENTNEQRENNTNINNNNRRNTTNRASNDSPSTSSL